MHLYSFLHLSQKARMKNSILLVMLISGYHQLAFTQSQNLKDQSRSDAWVFVEKMPEFPGGTKAMYDYLASCISADSSLVRDTSGYVIVQFYVEKDGSITSPKVVRSPARSLSDAALKYVSAMPRWTPAMMNDSAIACLYNLSVKFGRINHEVKNER
jgi:hypothetical protein